MPFAPKFTITSNLANALMRLEGARQAVEHLPITAGLLVALRESARLNSTHYSTMIEGNRLTQEQVSRVIEKQEHFPGSERDEKDWPSAILPRWKRRKKLLPPEIRWLCGKSSFCMHW